MSATNSTKAAYSRRLLGAAVALLLIAWGSAVAYYQAFSARQPYDDEGFLMGWVQSFLDGHPLYNEVHCFYGPAYFLYQALGHSILQSDPSTDSVRFIAIFFWVIISACGFFFISHTTGSWILGSVSYILVFRIAHFLGEEPGHPQELILLLSVIAMAVACLRWREPLRFFLLGAIAGTLAFTKINVGISLAIVLGTVFVFGLRATPFNRYLKLACVAIVALYPLLLFWPTIGAGWTQRYLLIEVCALLAIFVTIWPAIPDVDLDFRCAAAAACGFVLAAVVLILYSLASGTSIHAMIEYLVIRPRQTLGKLWYLAPRFPWWHLVSAPLGAVLATWVRFFGPRQRFIVGLKFAAAVGVLLLALGSRTGALFAIAPPFVWLIALPGEGFPAIDRLGRTLVALIAVLLFTYAYPVAGVHMRLVDVLLVLVALLLLGDVVAYATKYWNAGSRVRMYRAAGLTTAAAILVYGGRSLATARQTYYSESALNLPGAARLHLPENEVRNLRTMVATTARSCTFLVTVPAMPSFNEWTRLPSVSGLPFANWVSAYDDSAQKRIVEQLSSAPRPCIIENPSMIGFWTHDGDMSGRPITVYTRRKLREILVAGDNHLYAQ